MSRKHALLGNGIDIEFSGTDEYKNYAILQRMCNNLKETGRYVDIFMDTINAQDLWDFLEGLNCWFKRNVLQDMDALQLIANGDERNALLDMSHRYKNSDPGLLEIGLEDYLLALKLYNASLGSAALDYEALYQSISKMILDSIYNDGKIEKLWRRMGCFRPQLNQFFSIFTVNYDKNIDRLMGHPVFHLHGSFDTLHHEYRPEALKGSSMQQCKKRLPICVKEKQHLYCDAILGFSGQDKLKRMDEYNMIDLKPGIEELKSKYPKLEYPVYPIKEFTEISGELHIIGMGPNNDSHIFKMINSNQGIRKVFYYSANAEDTLKVSKIVEKDIEIVDVYEYWRRVRGNAR